MISAPPKTFLDTQIVINAANGRIPPEDWCIVGPYLRQTTRYCVSALTVAELLWALANSEEEHFEQHLRRLRALLAPHSQPEVFDFIPYFTARQLGLAIRRPAHLEDDPLKAINRILSAPSKAALSSGFSDPFASTGQRVRIRLDRSGRSWRKLD